MSETPLNTDDEALRAVSSELFTTTWGTTAEAMAATMDGSTPTSNVATTYAAMLLTQTRSVVYVGSRRTVSVLLLHHVTD